MLDKLAKLVLSLPELDLKSRLRGIFYGEVISERIVEYSLVFAYLGFEPSKNIRILDLGCYYSNFPIQLASMGFDVTAIDLMDYQLTHPNFKFIKGDITREKLKPSSFNIVTSISTIEHIGLGFYQNDSKDESGDKLAVGVIRRILKKNGKFIFSIPFGKKRVNEIQKVYNWDSLSDLLKGFRIQTALYYKETNGKWMPVSKKKASKIDSRDKTRAIVFIVAIKN